MYSILFWKFWTTRERIIFWFLFACLFVSLILLGQAWAEWPAPAISYDHFQQLQSIEAPSHSFSVGLINLTVPADSYIIFENIFGSAFKPNVLASYFFLTTLAIAFVLFMSIAPSLSRYRFLITIGIAILFLVSLQVEAVEVFGLANRFVTVGLILLYGLLAFYFHSFKSEAHFSQRLLAFSALTALVGFVISYFTKTTLPLLHISTSGLFAGMIVCLIFIIMVSHEIIAAFVTIISKSLKSTKSLQHFLILTSIYLLNVFLMFASKMGILDWSFFSVSPFFLIAVSGVLGIWGFRQREVVHENILTDEPLRIYFFFSLGLVAFGAMTYFMSSASDMMIDVLEDFIVAVHFGGGLIFGLYVIANFSPMLAKNLSVYKILYKPETMPHFTFRLMAVIATFAVLSWAVSWKTYLNQMVATYYHAHGDMYLAKGEESSAELFYLKSIQFRNQNLHAHYALASIYGSKSESIKERKEYEKAVEWSPSVPLYLNLARAYSNQGDVLESALTIDEGKKKFPKSGELQNAAGVSFLKLKQTDSALYFFAKAKAIKETKSIGETNLLAASASLNANQAIDSVISLNDAENNGAKANILVLANMKQQKMVIEGKFSNDSSLSIYEAMALCNYLINQKETADTTLIRNAINLAHKEANDPFAEQLLISSAHALYAHGLIKEALQIVREATYTANSGNYFSLMGLWLLEQSNPALASSYFRAATDKKQPLALYYEAIAETEADSLDSLRKSTDKGVAAFAEKMIKILKAKPDQVGNLPDDEKYYFCRYKISLTDKALFEKTVNTISDQQLRAQAIIDRSKKWFVTDEPKEAAALLALLNTVYSRNINQQVANLKLMLAVGEGNWEYIQKNISETEKSSTQKIYFEALQAAQSGNQSGATQKFNYLVKADNQFEEGIVAAVKFFNNETPNQLKNFSMLVDGLLAKPNSVKILKQHAVMAAALGFPDAAQDSLNKLHRILSDSAFRKFVSEHPDYFGKR
jgi:tetratricopeptide (TPR) repeat protein